MKHRSYLSWLLLLLMISVGAGLGRLWAASPRDLLRSHQGGAPVSPLGLESVLPPRSPPVAGERIRVATYNIAHARGNKRGGLNEIGRLDHLEGIARMLRTERVDIIGCAEISGIDFRSVLTDQPAFLANRLGFYHVYGENFRIALVGAAQGDAIISRFPIVAHKNHRLYRLSDKEEQRGCLEALIDLGNGRRIRVFVAHLSLKAQESSRQIQQILEMIKNRMEPCLFMGDFNSLPSSANIQAVRRVMTDLTANVDTTYLARPGEKLDYIFLRGGFQADGPAWVRGFKEGYSDHGCLIVPLRLVPASD